MQLDDLESKLSYNFRNKEIMYHALTPQCSALSERGSELSGNTGNTNIQYQRLEFLGDNVVGLAVSEFLYGEYPDVDEGALSIMRAHLTNGKAMVQVASSMGLQRHLRLSKEYEDLTNNKRNKILENSLEALMGGVFMDSTYITARAVIYRIWSNMFDALHVCDDIEKIRDYKSKMQEWAQKRGMGIPKYVIISKGGADHDPLFTASVSLNGIGDRLGMGCSKKEAEQDAARKMLDFIGSK